MKTLAQDLFRHPAVWQREGSPAQAPAAERALVDLSWTPTILLVDGADLNRRLIRAMLKSEPYRIIEARKASEAVQILEKQRVDLVILDLMLPEVNGADFCRWLKSNRDTELIPVLMITGVTGMENELAGIAAGADDFLFKPLSPALIRARVRTMIQHKAAIDTLEEAEAILFALAQTVEQRDKCTGDHCQRLATYSVALGIALGRPRQDLVALYRGGYLHDIGKIAVPDAVLFKQGKLTPEEWQLMRAHTIKGEEICRPMKSLAPVLPIIRHHHERWDGSGYPDGLAGEQIPLLARILQIADIYDALTTERPYKAALSHQDAIAILREESARGWRDPDLVSLFEDLCTRAGEAQADATPPPEWPDATPMQISLHNMSRALLAQQR